MVLPALERGRKRAGRDSEPFEVTAVSLVVTGESEEQLAATREVVRKQLAFYGSTPAYRPTLDCHGWGDLQPQLNAMSKQGRWDEMAGLITDEMLEAIAVVALRGDVAAALRARFDGLVDGVSIENTRDPDPANFADIVEELRGGARSV